MNFQQLETFRWVAKLNSFTQAARKLNTTQSTVSMRLAELERELGIVLLDRTRRRILLTPKGRDLLRYAEELAMLVSEIRQFVGNSRTISGTLRLGAAELVALTWLPALMAALKQRFPLVDMELHVGLGGGMLRQLEAGELDVVLMPTAAQPVPGMHAEPLGSVRFGLVASPAMQLPDRPLTAQDLQDRPVITHGASSVLHSVLEAWFEQSGMRMNRIITSNSMAAAAMLAQAGLGVTFLPLFYYQPDFDAGRLAILPCRPAMRPVRFSAVYPRGRSLPLVEAIVREAARHSTFRLRAKTPAALPQDR